VKITDAFLGEHAMLYTQFTHLEQAIPATEGLTVAQGLAAGLNTTLTGHAHLEDKLLLWSLRNRRRSTRKRFPLGASGAS